MNDNIPAEPKKKGRPSKIVKLSDDVVKSENIDLVKYTTKGHIRASWVRSEEKRKNLENNLIIEEKAKLLMDQQKVKEDAIKLKEQKRREDKAERDRIKAEKKVLIDIEKKKNSMRGKSEKCKEFQKRNVSKLHEGILRKMRLKEEERKKKFPDSDSESEEEEITIIKKKRSKSRTPDIDYRKLYEESIRKKTIREERDEQIRTPRNSVSPNIDRIRDIQRNIFKGIL